MTVLSFILLIVALETLPQSRKGVKAYPVKKISGTIVPSGKGENPLWRAAEELTDFTYPWEKERSPSTTFKALHNESWLYCLFEVEDPDMKIFQDTNDKSEVAASCRAELFFRSDDRLDPYYCLEIDPLGRVLDYKATYHRNFNFNWSWPDGGLTVKTSRTTKGYIVEFAVSKASLKKLGLLNDQRLEAGLYRGDCVTTSEGKEDFRWISWVKPDSKTPDFHIPSSFGILLLEE